MMTPPNKLLAAQPAPPASELSRERSPKRVMFGIALANLALWVGFFTPIVSTLQLRMAELFPNGGREIALSVLLAVGGVVAIVATPLVGRLSDRTTARIGMRRPWLIGTVLIGFVGVLLEASNPSYPLLVIGAALTQIGFAGGFAVLLSLLPDHIPTRRRGVMGSLLGVSQGIGIVAGIVVGGILSARSVSAAFIVPGIIAVLGVGILCVLLPDRRLAKADVPPFDARKFMGSFWVNPRRFPNYGWAWISRFAFFLAFAGVISYQVFFLQSQLHIPLAQTAALVASGSGLQTLMLLVFSFVGGLLSDRLKRRLPFVFIAALLGAGGLLVIAFATQIPMFFVGLMILGVAAGLYYSVDVALITQILPNEEKDAGKDLGVFTMANNLPQTLAPAVAPLFLGITVGSIAGAAPGQNFTALYVASAAFAIISAIAITRVRGVR